MASFCKGHHKMTFLYRSKQFMEPQSYVTNCRCQHLTNGANRWATFLPPPTARLMLLELFTLFFGCLSSHLVIILLPFLEVHQIPARLEQFNSIECWSMDCFVCWVISQSRLLTSSCGSRRHFFTSQRWQSHFFISLRQNEIWKRSKS